MLSSTATEGEGFELDLWNNFLITEVARRVKGLKKEPGEKGMNIMMVLPLTLSVWLG